MAVLLIPSPRTGAGGFPAHVAVMETLAEIPLPRFPGENPGLAAWEPRVRSRSRGFAFTSCQPGAGSVFIFANMTQLEGNRICAFHRVSGPGMLLEGWD